MASHVNILLHTFAGLELPRTVSLPLPADLTIPQVDTVIRALLPTTAQHVILTTTSNFKLPSDPNLTLSCLATHDALLPIHLSVPILGGKGGFGSQLRAAGGRMASKKKKKTGEENASSRNLDGRRLRTVNEAKALAEYLAIKPEMAKKEKEERRKRWEQVVEVAERREEEIRKGRGRLDGKWVEEKEEVGERTREAVLAAMKGQWRDNLNDLKRGATSSEDDEAEEDEIDAGVGTSSKDTTPPSDDAGKAKNQPRKLFGFDDDDDEFMSDDEASEQGEGPKEPVVAAAASKAEPEVEAVPIVESKRKSTRKGKGKA